LKLKEGRWLAVPQLRRLVAGFEPRSGHVGIVVGKVALGQALSENFGFPYQFSFHRLFHNNHLSSGAGTVGQCPTYQVVSVSPHPQEGKKKLTKMAEELREDDDEG
jgi:hypothetical protein